MLPQCFTESFKLNSAVHQRQTRKYNDVYVILMKKVICCQSILYNGAKMWNDIPVEIRSSHNLTRCWSKLKKYLISKYWLPSTKALNVAQSKIMIDLQFPCVFFVCFFFVLPWCLFAFAVVHADTFFDDCFLVAVPLF